MQLHDFTNFFFVGIAGTGMSAIAQYLQGIGKQVSGSDRLFSPNEKMPVQTQFEAQGIQCFFQDGSGIDNNTQVVIVSTAIEKTNVEYKKALSLNIPIVKRSELLAAISNSIKTIAVGGTSGKSTTTAMIFHILETCGYAPSLITGAGLSSLQEKGLPGNAWNGSGEWLVIEADESDGSIVNYNPEIGVLLNIDRDHKEFAELMQLFATFKQHTKAQFIVNQDYERTRELSQNVQFDFGTCTTNVGVYGEHFAQQGFEISFCVNTFLCKVPLIGKHNMENALAALAVVKAVGIDLKQAVDSLASFRGIYRRMQLVGMNEVRNIVVIDDFAHNPAEVAAAIKACQNYAERVVAYFQPHGFGPLRFMHEELSEEVAQVLRANDVFLIGDVYYAGGTVDMNISPEIVSDIIQKRGKQAVFSGSKEQSLQEICKQISNNCVVLTMGARDPKLDEFAKRIVNELRSY
ncbi:MAG: Mur ligase domain-containing protein [Bacteroidales bacterium]|jgi:UDP-N-acetylmuramate--alanine ligase|nr:Mur ligase domain-containing protein [Bacteroidales bacterium]